MALPDVTTNTEIYVSPEAGRRYTVGPSQDKIGHEPGRQLPYYTCATEPVATPRWWRWLVVVVVVTAVVVG